MKIPVNLNKDNCYKKVLEILSDYKPLNVLKNRELDVLAELNYWFNYYEDLELSIRHKMTFDYDTKTAIMDKLGISENILNNNLSSLRKKDFIRGRTLVQILPNFIKAGKVQIMFDITIE
jgi:hypothetical protein